MLDIWWIDVHDMLRAAFWRSHGDSILINLASALTSPREGLAGDVALQSKQMAMGFERSCKKWGLVPERG
jgi:hypothetical protein